MTRVSLTKGGNRYDNVTKALELIREDIDPRQIMGRQVLIKPNLVSNSKPLAVTHVDAAKAVIDFIRRSDPAEIVIAEASASGNTAEAYRNFGYDRLEGVELVDVNRDDYEMIDIQTLESGMRKVRISKTILNSDYRVSVARPKTHDHLFCTLTLKNMMGSVPHVDHVWIHGAADEARSPVERAIKGNYILSRNLLTIATKVRADLGVVDGLIGMEGDGPIDGTPLHLGVAAAGVDFISVDAVMTSVMGFDPRRKGDIYLADENGLGVADLNKIDIIGEEIDKVRLPFKPHTNYHSTQIWWMKHHPNYKWGQPSGV